MALCGSDDSVECGVPLGQLATEINGNIGFEPRFVFYRNDPNNENLFDLNAQLVDENCLTRAFMSFSVENHIGEYELIPAQFGMSPDVILGRTFFFQIDEDVILATFELIEEEPRLIRIDSIDDGERMIGVFQGTYVKRPAVLENLRV